MTHTRCKYHRGCRCAILNKLVCKTKACSFYEAQEYTAFEDIEIPEYIKKRAYRGGISNESKDV